MPERRRPRVIQHPLDLACRDKFVPAESFEHRANRLVGLSLRFPGKIRRAPGRTETFVKRVGKIRHRLERAPTSVKIPDLVNRPTVIRWEHRLQTLERRRHCARSNLGIEAPG